MSRSGYTDDMDDNWAYIRWRGAVASALGGKRGQAFLRELLAALDQLEQKRLIARELKTVEGVCVLGAVAEVRRLSTDELDPEDYDTIAATFDIPNALAQELMFMNDDAGAFNETPEERYTRMRKWILHQLKPPHA